MRKYYRKSENFKEETEEKNMKKKDWEKEEENVYHLLHFQTFTSHIFYLYMCL